MIRLELQEGGKEEKKQSKKQTKERNEIEISSFLWWISFCSW
jgi:hypothetical protein